MPFEELDIPHPRSIGIEQAHRTLRNGTRFLGSGLSHAGPAPIGGRHRAKVIGNGLRELDRFLSVLLDEVALAVGWERADLQRLANVRNTANKLGAIHGWLGRPSDDLARLRALGRCRDCLFHCNGVVRRGDERRAPGMTVGWPADANGDGAGARLALGERLAVSAADLAWVCAFYERIAGDLLEDVRDVRSDFAAAGNQLFG